MSPLSPFQQRVVDEKKELDERIVKLGAFLYSATFMSLPLAEVDRLAEQFSIMEEYSEILRKRIAAFT